MTAGDTHSGGYGANLTAKRRRRRKGIMPFITMPKNNRAYRHYAKMFWRMWNEKRSKLDL